MTNFEKIKKMNLADIAVLLFDIQADAMLSCFKNSKKKYPFGYSGFFEWLESDVEENMLPEICSCGYRFENDETTCPNCGKKVEEDG